MSSISVDSSVACFLQFKCRPGLLFLCLNNIAIPVVKLFFQELNQVPVGFPLVACVHTSNGGCTHHIKVRSMHIPYRLRPHFGGRVCNG